jgi:tetratricopeptide (TPR) repeat protein
VGVGVSVGIFAVLANRSCTSLEVVMDDRTDHINRRAFLTAGTAAASGLLLPEFASAGGELMGPTEALAAADRARRAWYRSIPGAAREVTHLAETIRNTYPATTWGSATDVERAAAIYHAASVVHLHTGDQTGAITWASAAMRLGRERVSYDANAVGIIAMGDAFPDNPRYRLSVLSSAKPLSPTMRALLAAHQASAHALAGDVTASLHCLDTMDAMLDLRPVHGWPDVWGREVSSTFGRACRGATSLLCGRLDDAEHAYRKLGAAGPNRLELAEAQVRLGVVLARKGEMDEAVQLASEAAAVLLAVSPRNRVQVTTVRDLAAVRGAKTDDLDEALGG